MHRNAIQSNDAKPGRGFPEPKISRSDRGHGTVVD